MSEIVELYRKYRPTAFKQMVGQTEAVRIMKGWLANNTVPHAMLFTGASGCGKTTAARILASKLKCQPPRDLVEINAADTNGVDMVRSIGGSIQYRPLLGDGHNRCWIIDEAALLSTQAQSAFLKILEEAPTHAYIILCTTDPQKLLPTVKNRCSHIQFNPVTNTDLLALCGYVLGLEGLDVGDAVLEALVENADGSPRKCLVKLGQLIELPDDTARLKAITQDKVFESNITELCKVFTAKSQKPAWREVSKIVKSVTDNNEAESIRYAILNWCASALLNGWATADAAASCMEIFQYNTYDSKKAGLALMCYRAWQNK